MRLLYLLTFIYFFFLASCSSNLGNSEHEEKEGLTVKKLYEEYQSNEVRFKKQYHNKKIKVSGIIHYVSETVDEEGVIDFKNDGLFGGRIAARFIKTINGVSITDLNEGQKITIEGELVMDGYGISIYCYPRK